MSDDSLPAGYEHVERIGQGNSGVVDRVRRAGVDLAYKSLPGLPPELCPAYARRFEQLRALRHPNLVQLISPHFDHRPPGYSMQLLEGPDLVTFVRGAPEDERASGRPARSLPMAFGQNLTEPGTSVFSLPGAAGIARLRDVLPGLCSGLATLHEAGFVHRDVSPANVRVSGGLAVLLDYELSLSGSEGALDDTCGTAAYMAPEQWQPERVGPPADLYALGLVLFEALTGALPFSGSAEHVFVSKRTVGAPRLSALIDGVPEDLDELCSALLRITPAKRPSARELVGTQP